MLNRLALPAFAAACLAWSAPVCPADVTLPGVVSDGMVLQRHEPVRVWGWADPGERVTVEFAGQRRAAVADGGGRWSVLLAPMDASSEPRALTVRGDNEIVVSGVVVGEVWVASGQSNMEWTIANSSTPEAFAQDAERPLVRFFNVPNTARPEPQHDAAGAWVASTPETFGSFSAVAYHFAAELQEALGVPVGVIDATWGGTPVEAWTSRETLASLDEARPILERAAASPRPEHPHSPASLFNGMIAPIVNYTARGFIWYQGESNADRAEQYAELFPAMITDWRRRWNGRTGAGAMPFYFVQLAAFTPAPAGPVDEPWSHLREAQLETHRALPRTGMAVTTDIGDANDIHPRNKHDVGRRLARWALADAYGLGVVPSGPVFEPGSLRLGDGRASVGFELFGSPLAVLGGEGEGESGAGGELTGFTIAGADGRFVLARARIEGRRVVVWAEGVAEPAMVRYAWATNPASANLGNAEGLPASPFRTDDLPGPTDGRR